jgi:hypothetical protein
MVGVDKRGLSSSKGVGSEEDNEVNWNCNYVNKVWGWKIEVGIVGEKGLLTKKTPNYSVGRRIRGGFKLHLVRRRLWQFLGFLHQLLCLILQCMGMVNV